MRLTEPLLPTFNRSHVETVCSDTLCQTTFSQFNATHHKLSVH
jgi:hypothetical protein